MSLANTAGAMPRARFSLKTCRLMNRSKASRNCRVAVARLRR